MGRPSSSKSTLLTLLLGALRPREGSVALRGRIASVPQIFDVAFGYSAVDMVLMGRARHVGLFAQPTARDEAAALAALDRFGIADLAHRPFHDPSGGRRRRVVLARALVAAAEVLLLNEPTSALDLRNQALVLRWVGRLAREDGLAVAFTTHHPHHALAAADGALLMLGSARFAGGAAGTVLTEANLRELYAMPMRRVRFEHDGRRMQMLVSVLDGITERLGPADV